MINDHIILQSHLIYFKNTCYMIRDFKKKSTPSPLLNPQSKHTLKVFFLDESRIKGGQQKTSLTSQLGWYPKIISNLTLLRKLY